MQTKPIGDQDDNVLSYQSSDYIEIAANVPLSTMGSVHQLARVELWMGRKMS